MKRRNADMKRVRNATDRGILSMAKRKKAAIPGLSFSWKRAFGISSAKHKIARATGIPTTKQGRRAKLGRIFRIK